jgi:hypothetical protein
MTHPARLGWHHAQAEWTMHPCARTGAVRTWRAEVRWPSAAHSGTAKDKGHMEAAAQAVTGHTHGGRALTIVASRPAVR